MATLNPFGTYYDSEVDRYLMFTDQKLDGTIVFTRIFGSRGTSKHYTPHQVAAKIANGTLKQVFAQSPKDIIDVVQQTIDKQTNTAA